MEPAAARWRQKKKKAISFKPFFDEGGGVEGRGCFFPAFQKTPFMEGGFFLGCSSLRVLVPFFSFLFFFSFLETKNNERQKDKNMI
jgi:hypothetical protein